MDSLLIDLLGGGYEIYSPWIEQSDWTVWTYHGNNYTSSFIFYGHNQWIAFIEITNVVLTKHSHFSFSYSFLHKKFHD